MDCITIQLLSFLKDIHSYAGRLSQEETSFLVDMSKSMVRPKEILVTLKKIKNSLNGTLIKMLYSYKGTKYQVPDHILAIPHFPTERCKDHFGYKFSYSFCASNQSFFEK